jgi:purine-nucleoside phosphorylase
MHEEKFQIPEALKNCGAKLAIVLGSGLGPFAESLEHELVVPYEDVPDLPVSKVPGHAGRFVVARLAGRPLLLAQGRVHLYEGWNASEVTRSVRMMHAMGIEKLILTNAAGTVNSHFPPGDWMMLSDHINLTGCSPLRGGPHFFDLSEVYSRDLRKHFRDAALALDIRLHEGVYAAMPGPQYETPAEIRMLKIIGADAVGMSEGAGYGNRRLFRPRQLGRRAGLGNLEPRQSDGSRPESRGQTGPAPPCGAAGIRVKTKETIL